MMLRTVFLVVVGFLASANAFLAPVPGFSFARTARSSGSVQMVTSPGVSTPAVSSSPVESSEAKYTETLKKMEADCLKDLETAFDETAKKAKSESDKIWADLDAELDDEDA